MSPAFTGVSPSSNPIGSFLLGTRQSCRRVQCLGSWRSALRQRANHCTPTSTHLDDSPCLEQGNGTLRGRRRDAELGPELLAGRELIADID
jgi:hypothetical protein